MSIDTHIPPPNRRPGRAGNARPWKHGALDLLKVGESFVPQTEAEHIRGSIRLASKRTGFRYVTEWQGNHWRVWRVA